MSVQEKVDMNILDSLSNSLYVLQDLGLITEQQVTSIYTNLPTMNTLQLSYCKGLIDLVYRINQMYRYYTIYSKYPTEVLNTITDDSNHIVLNILDYLKANPEMETKINIDTTKLDAIYNTIEKYLPNSTLYTHAKNAKEILSDVTYDNLSDVITQLFTLSRLIDHENIDEAIKRKFKSIINTIRLDLENISTPVIESKFVTYLKEEIKDSVDILVEKLV